MAVNKARVLEELEAIREAHGGLLTARAVLDFARENPESALHSCFEWDDSRAGEEFRIWQARQVIRLNVVVVPRSTATVRTYVSLLPDRQLRGGGYRHLSDVMADPDRRKLLLKQALREVERWREKYKSLVELAAVFDAIDDVEGLTEAINHDNLDLLVEETPS